MKLTDDHFRDVSGSTASLSWRTSIRRNAGPQIAEGIRRTLPPWEVLAADPPEDRLVRDDFPYADMLFNEFIIDWDLIEFVQRVLDTEEIFFRYAHNWVRYPDPGAEQRPLHIDNDNNSLLPPNSDVRYGQIKHLVLPRGGGREPGAHADRAQGPWKGPEQAGHADRAGQHDHDLQHPPLALGDRLQGQRGAALLGHPDLRPRRSLLGGGAQLHQPGEARTVPGLHRPSSRRANGSSSAFPPPGHEYYTEETLARLEEQYPGWNARGEYGL